MRIVPSSHYSEDDNSQRFWVFGPSFAQTPAETSASSSSEGLPPPLLLPPPQHPPPPNVAGKKRPRDAGKRSKKKWSERKRKKRTDVNSQAIGATPIRTPRLPRGTMSSERWTHERYERAELKVIDVMRENAAEFGHRIARRDLREGARKHIGDTGLLDHLLKHMAGKVVGDTGKRFMRGYSSDGVMQYWLEPADLEERKMNGEIGNGCHCGPECKVEINQLKERIGTLTRDMEELRSLKELEKGVWKENYEKLLKRNIKLEAEMEGMNNTFRGLKENYEMLLKRNIKLETDMAGMDSSFEGLKEEMILLREEKKKEDDMDSEVGIIDDAKGTSDNGVVDNSDNGFNDNHNENKQVIEKTQSFCSSQLRRPYLQLPCRGRVYVNCLNGSQKSLGHISPLSPSIESDQLPSQCTRQRH